MTEEVSRSPEALDSVDICPKMEIHATPKKGGKDCEQQMQAQSNGPIHYPGQKGPPEVLSAR
eukprot:jgi/Chlat1/8064/Chrsp73S09195